MKGQLFSVCAALVVVASFGACYGQSSPTDAWMQPGATISAPVNPAASPSNIGSTPGAAGAGPSTSGAPATMTVDNNFVYVLQE
ncbi:MAG: hypothetical protein ACYC64_13475 [Armatimonadota bacterium]